MRVRGKYLTAHYINTLYLFIHVVINNTNDGVFQAKQATCEDYSQGATEGSVGPFNESASEPTLSPSVLPESPVTAGK